MLQKKEKQIDGIAIAVTPFPVWHAFELKLRLAKKFIPAIAQLGGAGDNLLDMNIANFVGALENLLGIIDVNEFMKLVGELCEWVEVKNEKGQMQFLAPGKEVNQAVLNDVFAGKISAIYKIIFFVLEVNYPDFFALGSRIGK